MSASVHNELFGGLLRIPTGRQARQGLLASLQIKVRPSSGRAALLSSAHLIDHQIAGTDGSPKFTEHTKQTNNSRRDETDITKYLPSLRADSIPSTTPAC
jgi:hypothetical protein